MNANLLGIASARRVSAGLEASTMLGSFLPAAPAPKESRTIVENSLHGLQPEVDAFIRSLLDRASAIRLPELFAARPADALCWAGDRHGVTTVGLTTASLTPEQLAAIMRFRLAQYLMAHQLDPRLVFAERLEHEPLHGVTPDDVHFIAGATLTGEILAYGTFKTLDGDPSNVTMQDVKRPLFPVEEVFGRGLFDRLRILPDLPAHRIREAGRLMKSHRHQAPNELVERSVVELLLCAFRFAALSKQHGFDACVGDIEMGVAKKNMDFFHLPTVVLRGAFAYAPDDSFGCFNYQHRTRHPFALLCSEISAARLQVIEAALQLPGEQALRALLALKRDARALPSSLEPCDGLPLLDDVPFGQAGVPMVIRRQLLDVGEWLRSTTLFGGLSVSEATVLGTFMERLTFPSGTPVLRQGETGDDLFLIENGTADIKRRARAGHYLKVRELGPRDYFGEIALMAGGERTADVIATAPLTVLRLSRATYDLYLARMAEVERDLVKTALMRTHATLVADKSTVS